jgi:hypothetical protein
VGAGYFAVLGAARLVPAKRLSTRVIAGVAYAWTPLFAERLLLGQWGLLLAYAAMPWLIRAALGARDDRTGALPRLVLAAAVCAITPTGGVLALVTTAALTVDRRWRRGVLAVGVVALMNGPWLIAAALTTAGGRTDPAGVAAFAARAENWSGPLGAVAGTGGIWNAQTTPASRASALVPVVTLVLLALAVAGYPALRERWARGSADRLGVVALGGFGLALAGALPLVDDVLRWLVTTVPGAGLLRDGTKFLIPYAVLLALAVATGAERIAARLAEGRARAVLVATVVLPVALMPDLAFGGLGQLDPVRYPADWDAVAAVVATDPGETLSVPFHLYRRYEWNSRRAVIDPAPRYLPTDVLVDDNLLVGPVVIEGENRRAAGIRQALAVGRPLASTGVVWVLVQHNSGGTVPAGALEGLRLVYDGPVLSLYRNPAARPVAASSASGRRGAILTAYLVAVGLLGAAVWSLARARTAW